MKHSLRTLAMMLVVFLPLSMLPADVLELRNGRQFVGTTVSQNQKFIFFRTGGRVRRFPKRNVRRMRYGVNTMRRKKRPGRRVRPARTTRRPARTKPTRRTPATKVPQLAFRFGLVHGTYHSAFEERFRYESEAFLPFISGGGFLNIQPGWKDNSASGLEFETAFYWKMLVAEIGSSQVQQDTPQQSTRLSGSPATAVALALGSGEGELKRTERFGSVGWHRKLGGKLKLELLLGLRELELEDSLQQNTVSGNNASTPSSSLSLSNVKPTSLARGNAGTVRLTYRLSPRWRARLTARRSTVRGNRDQEARILTGATSGTSASASIALVRRSGRIAHRTRAGALHIGYRFAPGLWLYMGHSREKTKVHFSEIVQLAASSFSSNGSAPALNFGFTPQFGLGSQHTSRLNLTVIGMETRVTW